MPRCETGTQTNLSTGLDTRLTEEVKELRYLTQSLVGVLYSGYNNPDLAAIEEHIQNASRTIKELARFYRSTNQHALYLHSKKLALNLHLCGFPGLIEVLDL